MSYPAGYVPITTSSYEPGSGNPRQSALMAGQNSNAKLANLGSAVGGRKSRRRGGATNSGIPAPQFQMQYTPSGGPGTSPNDQIANLTANNMQTTSWSADDASATKMGGRRHRRHRRHSRRSRRHKKGGDTKWSWGCYSGGKSKSKSKSKTRKYRK